MTNEVEFRWAHPADYDEFGRVMFDAVRNGKSLYSDGQNAAWMPEPRSGTGWADRLHRQRIILAERAGQILGFMSLADGGYVDFAYIRPDSQGSGLFRQLFERIEQQAIADGQPLLWVHASLTAQPAFSTMGFAVRNREEVELGGEHFERFVMEKKLGAT